MMWNCYLRGKVEDIWASAVLVDAENTADAAAVWCVGAWSADAEMNALQCNRCFYPGLKIKLQRKIVNVLSTVP